jgi:hypothetical protein
MIERYIYGGVKEFPVRTERLVSEKLQLILFFAEIQKTANLYCEISPKIARIAAFEDLQH